MKETERSAGFYGEDIEVEFPEEPLPEKRPGLPTAFTWRGDRFVIARLMREWHEYGRSGPGFDDRRQPAFMRGGKQGSWGVGRDYYRVLTEGGEVFDLCYDRRPRAKAKGGWTLYRKIGGGSAGTGAADEGGQAPQA